MKNPIFLALDVDSREEALSLVQKTFPWVGGYKIGPRLAMRYGESFIREVAEKAEVFIDNKYYDIPNTMIESVRSTFAAGASYCTVHAQAGPVAIKALAELEADLNKERPFKILAVTVLTSFDINSLPITQVKDPIIKQVEDLALQCSGAGLSGFVCSGQEVENLKLKLPFSFVVTPGIRLPEDGSHDQVRVLTPAEALGKGADALVVGRPISGSKDPGAAARRYFESI